MFYGKGNRITFNGSLELFYKEDEKSPYPVCKRSAKYVGGRAIVVNALTTIYI
jgi:hypothetical protein